jgi:hypothetical protein
LSSDCWQDKIFYLNFLRQSVLKILRKKKRDRSRGRETERKERRKEGDKERERARETEDPIYRVYCVEAETNGLVSSLEVGRKTKGNNE